MNDVSNRLTKFLKTTSIASALMLGLAACSDSDDDNDVTNAQVRLIHASPDAPAVNILVNGSSFASNLDYGEATTIETVASGIYDVQIDAILPGNATAAVIEADDVPLTGNNRFDVIAVGSVAEETLEPIVIETPVSFDESLVRVTVVHLAPEVGMVDVYVTAPSATIAESTAVGTFDFKDSASVEVPADSYRIRITGAGSTTAVYDTGETGIALTAGSDLLVGAFENTQVTDSGASKAPVALRVINGGDETALYNVTDGADLRVVHASPDAPAVDVFVAETTTPELVEVLRVAEVVSSPLIDNLAFTEFSSPYANTPADSYDITVAADADNSIVAIDVDGLELSDGSIYTVLAVGELTSDPVTIEALVVNDTPRSIATAAQVRVIHASTLANDVDVYVVADGAGIEGATPVLEDVPFKGDSGYLQLDVSDDQNYDIIVTGAGSTTAAITADLDGLQAGEIYTAVAIDGAGPSTPLGLILMDGFVVAD